MLFQTSRQTGRIPLVLVLGEEGAGKTPFLNLLLKHRVMEGSVVVGPVQTSVEALKGASYIALPSVVQGAQESCLCCGMHSGLGDVLRKLFFEALKDRSRVLNRVFIESREIESGQLAYTLRHTPFLGQRYFHQLTFRLISASRLLSEGIHSLAGLEPESGHDQQMLIISDLITESPKSEGRLLELEPLRALQTQILRSLPYRQVLYLDPETIASELNLV